MTGESTRSTPSAARMATRLQARNNDLDAAGTFEVDEFVGSASVADYDALLLPGGTVNPDKLRVDEAAVARRRGWFVDKFPMGALMNKGMTVRGAQQHGHRSIPQDGCVRAVFDPDRATGSSR